jgi:WD40 repeat protein
VCELAFSEDSAQLVSSAYDTVRVVAAADGSVVAERPVYEGDPIRRRGGADRKVERAFMASSAGLREIAVWCGSAAPPAPDYFPLVRGDHRRALAPPTLAEEHPRPVLSEVIAEWSPDATRLASWWPQARRLWITDVATGDTLPSIALDLGHEWVAGVDWSPDGDRLAVATAGVDGTRAVWSVPVDGGPPTRLLADSVPFGGLRWPEGGDGLYYARHDEPTHGIWRLPISPSGVVRGDPVRILSGIRLHLWSGLSVLGVSTQRSTLTYVRETTHSNLWLWRLEDAGTVHARRLTSGTALRLTPRLSPDGTEIVYTETASGAPTVFVMRLADLSTRRISSTEGATWSPVWSPDGRQIAYGGYHEGQGTVWLVDSRGGEGRPLAGTRIDPGNDLA